MKSKKGFELSINMIVVLILGLVILGVGTSIFFSAYNKVVDLRDDVSQENEARINSLLDDGSIIVIPFSSKDGKRGDPVDFDMGINNELGDTYEFSVLVTYAGTSADPDGTLFEPVASIQDLRNYLQSGYVPICSTDPDMCGTSWVMKFDSLYVKKDMTILNNEREFIPIRIVIPKKGVAKGQYVFNVDVCYNSSEEYPTSDCVVDITQDKIGNRYGSREKLYITI